jgi:hypothetical protein
MLVLSTKFMFLGLFISVASGSPAVVTPNHPSILEARNPPDPDPCIGQTTWKSRECDPERGPGVYFDSCEGEVMGQMHTFKFYGNCGPDFGDKPVCQNIVDDQGDDQIECISYQELLKGKRKLQDGSVVGSSEVKTARPGLSATQFKTSVDIDDKMGASVSAVLLSKSYCQLANPSRC